MNARSFVAGLAVALGLAQGASAALLPFSATLTLQVGPNTFVSSGSGVGSSAGLGGAATLPSGAFAIQGTAFISPPLFSAIYGLAIGDRGQFGHTVPFAAGSNDALSFNGTTGTMGLDASAYLLNTKNKAVAAIKLTVIGVGGTFTGSATPTSFAYGNPFQLGMASAMGTLSGATTSTLVGSGFDARTAGGLGTLQLVSPGSFALEYGVFPLGTVPVLATIQVTYTPEPGTALLLTVGAVVLGLEGRRVSRTARQRSR